MAGKDQFVSEVAEKATPQADRPAPDMYTGEPPLPQRADPLYRL